jgi:hypothetical protein
MKKLAMSLILGASIVLAPFSAFALEAMDEENLKSTTGQAGVSIAADDVVIYQKKIADVKYTDTDGLSSAHGTVGAVTSASLVISHDAASQKLFVLNAILDDTVYGTAAMATMFADVVAAGGTLPTVGIIPSASAAGACDPTTGIVTAKTGFETAIAPLTIDIGTCPILTQGFDYNFGGSAPADIAGVIIGLPTLEINIYRTNDIKTISLEATGAANSGKEFIQIETNGSTQLAILGGRLEIAPH